MEHQTIKAILDRAINEEDDAARRYRELASRAENDELRDLLMGLVAEEETHRASLEMVREGDLSVFSTKWPSHDNLLASPTAETPEQAVTIAQAMLRAIESERKAFLLYKELAMQADDPGIRTLLESLAKEEANHWAALDEQYTKVLHS